MRTFRRLRGDERLLLLLIAARIRREVDDTLADLVEQVVGGDDSALVPATDRLRELGMEADADRLASLCGL
jgi:hypothetical protein